MRTARAASTIIGPLGRDPSLGGLERVNDGADGLPISRGDQRYEQCIELTKMTDRLHVTTVFADRQPIGQRRHAHEPIATLRNGDWQRGSRATGTGQKAHEANEVWVGRWLIERSSCRELEQVSALAKDE